MNGLAEALPRLILLAPLMPLLAALGIALRVLAGQARGDEGEPATARLALGAALGSLLAVALAAAGGVALGPAERIVVADWFDAGGIAIRLSFMTDALSLALAALVALIGAITLRFARDYLHREAGFHRFFLAMCVFLSGMLLIVLAGNAALAFVGWELAGVSSWLLIGYAYDRPVAAGNAQFAFVANRIGDAGFVLGIALAAVWLGTLEWPEIAQGGARDTVTARMIALGFVLAALVKSAQLPFTPWIARALEGPTPSSAIFYGAVMVHAGVYLLIRIEPLLAHVPDLMFALAVVGALTALYGWFVGLAQTDVKSALIFATVSQVGLMVLACGLGWFELAAWHLGLHAAWRAYQFLMAPSYMHLVERPAPPPPRWLARSQLLYTAALQRGWLDPLAHAVLIRPTQALGRDARILDDEVLSRMVGMPDELEPHKEPVAGERDPVIVGRGLAGGALAWIADRLQRVESRLLWQSGEGTMSRALRRAGDYLIAVETLLERPRYLILLVLATFVVIL